MYRGYFKSDYMYFGRIGFGINALKYFLKLRKGGSNAFQISQISDTKN